MEREAVFIVDWDLPSGMASQRVAFYRALKRLRKQYGSFMSSQSVLVTPSEDLARAVHSLASRYGTSNFWRAVALNK